jgi:hypothetical protein
MATFALEFWSTFFEFAKLVMALNLFEVENEAVLGLQHFVEYVRLKRVGALRHRHLPPHLLELRLAQILGNFIVHLSQGHPGVLWKVNLQIFSIFLSVSHIQIPQ